MPAPLLATKLHVPRPRAGLVSRPRLSQRLDAGAASTLMLVSAPAGFGKTTLLAEWLADPTFGPSVAWVSLDRGDNDPMVFWRYVFAALGTAEPGIGAHELALLATPQPPPIQQLLTSSLNDLDAAGGQIVLILDDYHLVESREVQEAMTFLLDHLSARLHLVIASRADPDVPLARLRARGELVEVRAADLRFTPEEVASYLNGMMGLQLTAHHVTALEERTEGWIAALQLAALSMQGRDDVAGFIAGFTGDDRYIVDYLAEEVLNRQPAAVRNFLLQTSVLRRLNGALCDAVTDTTGGKAVLESLDRGNLFVVPLDDHRQWYRYHHLFGDVLHAHLSDESPELVAELHRRACDWFAANGDPAEAIEHAIAGGHHARAADLLERALRDLARDRQEAMLRDWVERLPERVLAARPVLSNGYAGALMSTGQFEDVERHLRNAERWLETPADEQHELQMVVADDEGLRDLAAGVAVHRAGLALATGDPVATVAHAQRALSLLDQDHHLGQAAAAALIGLATWSGGDLETARDAYVTSLASMRRAGHLADVLGLSIALADIQVTQGSLRDALHTYEQALKLNPEHGPVVRGTADMYVGMSALHRERNDLPTARQLLVRSRELGVHAGLPQNPYRWRVAMAQLSEAEGDLDAAVDLLDEAERVYVGDFSPNVRPVPATRARMWVRQGRTGAALAWARTEGLGVEDDLSYLREYEHVTLARVLLGQHHVDRSLDQAALLLDRLLDAADAGNRAGSIIEILVLRALVHRLRSDVPAALVAMARALAMAEPEGYIRIFLDEGAPMTALLREAAGHGIATPYAEQLLAAAKNPAATRPHAQGLVDPLSERELDVLRLLGSDLAGPEIAGELVVSLHTVRTHSKNIYAKLGVNSRRAAVRRGEELGLMSRPRSR
jgi:LuxR family maltose regulon positive regulatory protein